MDDRDLEDLYRRMQGLYASSASEAGAGVSEDDNTVLIRKKIAALQTYGNQRRFEALWAMPAGYVLNTPLGEIASHLQLLDRLDAKSVVLDVSTVRSMTIPNSRYAHMTIPARACWRK